MKEVTWDDELAALAESWAATCPTGHNPSRVTASYSSIGENMYYSLVPSMYGMWPSLNSTHAIQRLFSEVTNPGFNPAHVNPFQYTSGVGHYTQIVWANTDRVGKSFFSNKKNFLK